MSKDKFIDQYKDPRWQKKRLEILQRDKFTCRSCTDNTTTLHVHHLKYNEHSLIWEYGNEDLITLCETCHEAWHYLNKHPTIGFETFYFITQLDSKLEYEAINKFFASKNKI